MKKSTILILLIVAAIVVAAVYNLPYFREMRAYDEAVQTNEIFAYDKYLSDYPDGRHAENVMMHKFDLAYYTADRLNYAQDYINKYPDGVFADLVNARIDSIWDDEIYRYKNRAVPQGNSDATDFMLKILSH